ncbi:hypothetical protein ACFXTN_016952 [Malus domestica]
MLTVDLSQCCKCKGHTETSRRHSQLLNFFGLCVGEVQFQFLCTQRRFQKHQLRIYPEQQGRWQHCLDWQPSTDY